MNYYRKYKKEKELLTTLENIRDSNVEHLFFDYNSLIHPCAQQILSANYDKYSDGEVDNDEIEADIITNCLNYTQFIIDIVKCKNVYIVIDGVAPRAKISQQRERRYKSHFFKELEGGKSSLWDSNKITPGTMFMEKLTKSLQEWAQRWDGAVTLKISDSNQPGEGEHKMMRMLDSLNGKVCVYGLDCITEDTPLLLQNANGEVEIQTVGNITNHWEVIDGKEYGTPDYKIWTEMGWTKINNIRRNKVEKNIFRILTDTGCIDVTEDHKLLKENEDIITPNQCIIGDKLLTSFPPPSDDHRLNKMSRNLSTYNREAYAMGLFWARGSCVYSTNIQWRISNCDRQTLTFVKSVLEEIYTDTSFTVSVSASASASARLTGEMCDLTSFGGSELIEKYSKLFYCKSCDPKHRYANCNKFLSSEILNASLDTKRAFLEGYCHIDNETTQASVQIEGKIGCQSIFYLCRSLGYEVTVVSSNIITHESIFDLEISKCYRTKNSQRIQKIINLGRTDAYVYDLQTDNHHFQAGIGDLIVHNCDLIFLSMLHKASDDIILIRDNSFHNDNGNIDYVNIKNLKLYILNDVLDKFQVETGEHLQSSKELTDSLTQYYILLCFFLGNDFLEHLYPLHIKDNGMDIILKAYVKASRNHPNAFLVDIERLRTFETWKTCINLTFLKDILYQLKNFEDFHIRQGKRRPSKINLQQIEESNLANSNLYFYTHLQQSSSFRGSYNNFYGISGDNADTVCFNYIEGLYWVLGYYNSHIHKNWSWYYTYRASPLCEDLFNYLKTNVHLGRLQGLKMVHSVVVMPNHQSNLVVCLDGHLF